ncbi:MAG: DNA internalization-related competence protein ComEC/Rec2 [Clostridia bacterium]|nr:DNA internalization-related competence protein ComEC/Rec2 [Clostridia bacterium]
MQRHFMCLPVPTLLRWLLPGMTAGLMVGILIGRMAASWYLAAIALVFSILLCSFTCGRNRYIALILTAACAGCLLSWHAYNPPLPAEDTCQISGVITQEINLREDGQVQTILHHVTINGQRWPGGAYWTFYLNEGESLPDALLPGAAISIIARVYHPSGADNPGGFDFREYLLQRGVRFGIYGADSLSFPEGVFTLRGTLARIRHELSQQLMTTMGTEAGGYAAAMLLGERRFIPDDDSDAFRNLGIAHILSVSGYHVGVLAAMLTLLLRIFPLSRTLRLAIQTVILTLYCLLTGGDAPVIRAALLYLIREIGHIRLNQNLPLHTLCLSASIQLLVTPPLLTSASFQLSYGAMLGMLLIRPYLRQLLSFEHPAAERLWDLLSASLAAQLGILPAQLYWFGELPLLSLIANSFLMSFVSLLMGLYWLVLALLPFGAIAAVPGALASAATSLLLRAVRWLGSLDGTALWTKQANVLTIIGWLMVMLGLSVLLCRCSRHRRPLVIAGALAMVVSLIPLPHHATTYIQLSVGEADTAVLHDRDAVIVIDTGEDGDTLASYLHQRRMSIDLLILTHLHSDHAGGLQALLDDGIPISCCYLPVSAERAADVDPAMLSLLDTLAGQGTEIVRLSRGDVITLPSGTLTCLWPVDGQERALPDANHGSLTLLADLHGSTMLLTGDLSGIYEMYAAQPADILKAAHHGSTSSTSLAFLAEVAPQVVLLSCGNDARVESLRSRTGSLPLYDTHTRGALTLRFTEGGFTVSTFLTDP